MKIRRYNSIPNLYKCSDKFFNEGDIIHVSEKIDGANASFRIDNRGKVHYYSSNSKLSDTYGLRGYVEWAKQNLDKDKIELGYIYYGEWVVRHRVEYTNEINKTFMLFDVYDVEKEEYLPPDRVEEMANLVGIRTPSKLYEGVYTTLDHISQFVGVGEYCKNAEGIVIRNLSTKTICKWVREDFREEKIPKQPKQHASEVVELFAQLCTDARVEKILHKGLDEEVYTSFDTANLSAIMKYCGNSVISDILKENRELISSDIRDEFVKYTKSRTPTVVKRILK